MAVDASAMQKKMCSDVNEMCKCLWRSCLPTCNGGTCVEQDKELPVRLDHVEWQKIAPTYLLGPDASAH